MARVDKILETSFGAANRKLKAVTNMNPQQEI